MGAYLSAPIKKKESESGGNDKLCYGTSAMQGWRMYQEDAHNCIADFEEGCSLFAVYDGHGGPEVSQYLARKFPDFLKTTEMWAKGRYGQALEDAFMKFDELLTDSNTIEELEVLAGIERDEKAEDDEDIATLFEEATLPIEEVFSRYGITVCFNNKDQSDNVESTDSEDDKIRTRKSKISGKKRKFLKDVSANNDEKVDKMTGDNSTANTDNAEISVEQRDKKHAAVTNNEVENSDAGLAIEPAVKIKRASNGRTKDDDANATKAANGENVEEGPSAKRNKTVSGFGTEPTPKNVASVAAFNGLCPDFPFETRNSAETNDRDITANGKETSDDAVIGEDIQVERHAATKDDADNVTLESTEKTFCHVEHPSSEKCSDQMNGEISGQNENGEDVNESDDEEDTEYADESDEKEDSSAEEDEDSGLEDELNDEVQASEGEEEIDEDVEAEEVEDFLVPPTDAPGVSSGSTACVTIIRGDTLYVANAGDSRCVLCRAGRAVDLSDDHKPEDRIEKTRIENAGGRISEDGRVNGGLNLSRAIGDHFYKTNTDLPLKDQMITALPDVRVEVLLPEDRFLVLACDGIWNSMSSQSVVDFVSSRLDQNIDLVTICEEICDGCLAESTAGDGTGCDNMTIIIVDLKRSRRNKSNDIASNSQTEELKRPKEEKDESSESQASDSAVVAEELKKTEAQSSTAIDH